MQNTQQDKDKALQEAAEKYSEHLQKDVIDKFAQHSFINVVKYCKEDFINGAKSEATKQYHSKQPDNLEELRKEFIERFNPIPYNTRNQLNDIFNFFLPYLSQPNEKK